MILCCMLLNGKLRKILRKPVLIFFSQKSINILRSEFIIKCTPEQFVEFNSSIVIQRKIDPKIDAFECFMENSNVKEYLKYLSYKGMLLIPGRDFVYYKRIKLINNAKNVKLEHNFKVKLNRFGVMFLSQQKMKGMKRNKKKFEEPLTFLVI